MNASRQTLGDVLTTGQATEYASAPFWHRDAHPPVEGGHVAELVGRLALDWYGLDLAKCPMYGDMEAVGYPEGPRDADVFFVCSETGKGLANLHLFGYGVDGVLFVETGPLSKDVARDVARFVATIRGIPEDWAPTRLSLDYSKNRGAFGSVSFETVRL